MSHLYFMHVTNSDTFQQLFLIFNESLQQYYQINTHALQNVFIY